MPQSDKQPGTPRAGRDDLTQQMGRILAELAELEPPDILTVPLALPLDLAAYVSELGEKRSVELPPIYVSLLLHGALHGALEHGLRADVQRLLAMIRRLAPEEEWQHFVAQHPGVREGGGRRRGPHDSGEGGGSGDGR